MGMNIAAVDDFKTLVDRYAEIARTDTRAGRERNWGLSMIEAITDTAASHSNAAQLQKVRALLAAVDVVTEERESTR
jgi:hypothetical protein